MLKKASDTAAAPPSSEAAVTGSFGRSLTLCIVVIAAYVFTTERIDENLRTGLIVLLFGGLVSGVTSRVGFWIWPGVTVLLAAGIALRPIDVPNHHWMMTYLSASITLACLGNATNLDRSSDLKVITRRLIVVLMGFATVQKLLSRDFMDGSYIGFELARGGFANPVLKLIPGIRETIEANASLVDRLHQTPPESLSQVFLDIPVPGLTYLAYGFTASILFIEAWLFLGMLRFPNRLITHYSLIAFASTLAVLRQEFTFISVVCTLGLLSCDIEMRKTRCVYFVMAILTAAAVLKTLNVG